MRNPRLETWQEIASHLGKSISTVQRWERERGLPVHRLTCDGMKAGKKHSNVYALPEELDAWMSRQLDLGGLDENPEASESEVKAAEGQIPAGWRWRLYAGLAALTALTAAIGYFWFMEPPNPSSAAIEADNELVARDASGRRLWGHSFPQYPPLGKEDPYYPRSRVADLDGDGRNEVIYIYFVDLHDRPTPNYLICFESDGRVRWTFSPDLSPQWAGKAVSNSFSQLRRSSVGRFGNGKAFVALVANHSYAGASQVSILAPDGSQIGEYLHTGYVFDLVVADTDGDGRDEILLGGINNRHENSPFLALIGPHIQSAISPAPEGFDPLRQSGKERLYVLAPRTDVADALHVVSRTSRVDALPSDRCFAAIIEMEDDGEVEERVYTLDYALRPMNLVFAQDFVKLHRELESNGKLDHAWDEETEKEELVRMRRLVPPEKDR